MESNHTFDFPELMSLLKWLIEKTEALRTNNIHRAQILITSASILVGAYSFFLGRILNTVVLLSRTPITESSLYFYLADLPVLVGFGLTCFSLFLSIDSVVHLKKRSRDISAPALPERYFFHARETIEQFQTFENFYCNLQSVSHDILQKRAAAELWSIYWVHSKKYEVLRRSGWMLICAVCILFYQLIIAAILRVWVF